MTEFQSSPEFQEPPLDRARIVETMQQLGFDIEPEDFEGLDDNDILGMLATYAGGGGHALETLLEAVGVPVAEA